MTRLLRLARPQFLVISFLLYLLGNLWAVLLGGHFFFSRVLLGYIAVLPAHLSVSFSNDYFDTAVDSFAVPGNFSGGSGILVHYPELRNTARLIAIALIIFSLAITVILYLFFSFPSFFVVILIIGNLTGWFYSAPPLRLSYRGWGEISTAMIASLLTLSGFIVSRSQIEPDGLLLLPPSILYGLAFILTVEIPDEEADRLGDKKTWTVRWGESFSYIALTACLLASTLYFCFIPYFFTHHLPVNHFVLVFLSIIPLAAGMIGNFLKPRQTQIKLRFTNLVIASLAIFLFLLLGYFMLLII